MANRNLAPLEEDPIVITGMGCVTPLGLDVQSTWDGLMEGRHGFINLREETDILNEYPIDVIQASVAAPIGPDFNIKSYPAFANQGDRENLGAGSWDRSAQFALAAGLQAGEQAGILREKDGSTEFLLHSDINPRRVGVFNGTGIGGAAALVDIHARLARGSRIPPSMTMKTLPERAASVISMELGSRGPTAVLMGACATGNMNIVNGAWALALGKADVVLAGGSEAAIRPEALAMFDGVGAMDKTPEPEDVSRPFHQDENGFIMGEGGGILVMERESHARARGAVILARLVGTGWTSDAYHDSSPDPDGVGQREAINEGLEEAEEFIDSTSSGYIQTHGTATGGDKLELQAMALSEIRNTGNHEVVVSSTKSAMGHLIGAAGAVESIMAIKAIVEQTVPATLKFSPDTAVEAAKEWDIVHGSPRKDENLGWAVNNSFGFGGFNAVTVYTRPR